MIVAIPDRVIEIPHYADTDIMFEIVVHAITVKEKKAEISYRLRSIPAGVNSFLDDAVDSDCLLFSSSRIFPQEWSASP